MDLKTKTMTKKLLIENVNLNDKDLGHDIFALFKYFNQYATRQHLFIKQSKGIESHYVYKEFTQHSIPSKKSD